MIIIGLGPPRSGTSSLTNFLNHQEKSIVFHELNSSCIHFNLTRAPIRNTIGEFQRVLDGGDPTEITADLSRAKHANSLLFTLYNIGKYRNNIRIIGDVAFYYIGYVDYIMEMKENVRFICMHREKSEVIKSLLNKTSIKRGRFIKLVDRLNSVVSGKVFYKARNHWMKHDGSIWLPDPLWDKCYPDFQANDREGAVSKYVDYYYREAKEFETKYKNRFKIFDINDLNTLEGQRQILSYLQIEEEHHVYTYSHENRGVL